MTRLEIGGVNDLRRLLATAAAHGPVEVTVQDAARLTVGYRVLLEVIGDGVNLTPAGYLPPKVVTRVANDTGWTGSWIGALNREYGTPVQTLRTTARALGLVTVRKDRLTVTAAARKAAQDPQALWSHIASRLPVLTCKDFEQEAGWLLLAVAAADLPKSRWGHEVGRLMAGLGWRSADPRRQTPHPFSPTWDVLSVLTGTDQPTRDTADPAIAATARAAIREKGYSCECPGVRCGCRQGRVCTVIGVSPDQEEHC